MAEHRPPEPTHSGSFSRALLVAVMVAVLYGAILFAIDGLISLLSDQNVIAETDAGPLVGPIMTFAALCVVFVSVLSGLRPALGRRRIPVGRAILTGLAVLILGPAVGSIVYSLGQEQILSGMPFFVRYLVNPFVLVATLLAVITVLMLPLISLARSQAR